MNNQKVADFESEVIGLCGKYEKDMPHAALVGVLTVVAHIYMDAQLSDIVESKRNDAISEKLEERGASPLSVETKL